MDGDDEVNDYYAGIVSSSVSAVGSDHHPRDISISPSQTSSDCVFLNAAVSARLAAVSVESDEFKKTRPSQNSSDSFALRFGIRNFRFVDANTKHLKVGGHENVTVGATIFVTVSPISGFCN